MKTENVLFEFPLGLKLIEPTRSCYDEIRLYTLQDLIIAPHFDEDIFLKKVIANSSELNREDAGNTLTHLACEVNNVTALKILLRNNSLLILNDDCKTPLDICREKEHESCSSAITRFQQA